MIWAVVLPVCCATFAVESGDGLEGAIAKPKTRKGIKQNKNTELWF